MKNDKDKIIERVRRLMAMAQDSSSPNEAAIAAGRARALMDKHQLALEDISESDGFGESCTPDSYIRYPVWKQTIAIALGRLNDCKVDFGYSNHSRKVHLKFQGFEMDSEVCRQMYMYLIVAVERMAKQFVAAQVSLKKVKGTYLASCSSEIAKRLRRLEQSRKSTPAGKGLVLAKSAMVTAKFGETNSRETKFKAANFDQYRAAFYGERDGKKIGLSDQVTGTRRGAITSTH